MLGETRAAPKGAMTAASMAVWKVDERGEKTAERTVSHLAAWREEMMADYLVVSMEEMMEEMMADETDDETAQRMAVLWVAERVAWRVVTKVAKRAAC